MDKSKYPYWSVAALSKVSPFYLAGPIGGCGQCFEVQCVNSGGQYPVSCTCHTTSHLCLWHLSICPWRWEAGILLSVSWEDCSLAWHLPDLVHCCGRNPMLEWHIRFQPIGSCSPHPHVCWAATSGKTLVWHAVTWPHSLTV